LLNGLGRAGAESPVAASMEASFRVAAPGEPVERALARLHECHCHTLPVVRDGKLCGVLTTDTVAEFVMINAALRGSSDGHVSR